MCCLQEVRWRGASTRMVDAKDSRWKFFWVGNAQGTGGVDILLAEKWVEKMFDMKRVSDRIMLVKIIMGESIVAVLSVYAPQVGLDDQCKDAFYDDLRSTVSKLGDKEFIIACGDWNGHIGKLAAGFESIHDSFGYGECQSWAKKQQKISNRIRNPSIL